LKIAETQAKDITLGQTASIDTRNGIIRGRVSRIDPAAIQGTVTVDVQLDGELPRGARPDLSVDGTVEIERLNDTVFVGRPAYGQADTTVGMFKILPTGEAVRVRVKLGHTAVNTIEVVEGLQVGDQVILSDMSQWDAYDRVKLN
jgi:HlyD family secretion protein